MPALTRGSLPARVYWVRRLLVLGTAVALVFGIGRVLNDGSDASSSGGDGARLAAEQSSAPTSGAPVSSSPATPTPAAPTTSLAPVLATPVGTCRGSDISVTPTVQQAVAGRDVTIVLEVRTLTAEACTWPVSPSSLTVDITSGHDQIWASHDCPRAVPHSAVVVRRAVTTAVPIVWKQAKRSDESCSPTAGWAYPGWYHVTAAALGGEPADLQFQLTTPTAVTVTKTATPKQQPSNKPSHQPSGTPSHAPSHGPTATAPD